MGSGEIAKPALDKSFYEPNILMSLVNIGYGLGLFIVFGWLNYVVATGHWQIVLKSLCMLAFSVLAATGLYVLALLGHEALHGNICKNKNWSLAIGLFFSSSIVSYFDMGFAVRHWDHHRYTNTVKDPDLYPTAHLKTWWQRLLLSRIIFNFVYAKNAFDMALGKLQHVEKYTTPYSPGDMVFFSRLNILFASIWLSAYIALFIYDWRIVVCAIALPSLALGLIAGCQSYLDHSGLGDDQYRNAYSRTSPFMSMLYFGANYHLEHHLYPKVPSYRLHKVHRLLVESGLKDEIQPAIMKGFFAAYKTLAAKHLTFN